MKRLEGFTTLIIFLVFPWLLYAWVALTGLTCSGSVRVNTGPPRVAGAEDLATALEAALFINAVVVVMLLLIWLKHRRHGRRRSRM